MNERVRGGENFVCSGVEIKGERRVQRRGLNQILVFERK
jgi:hypothetical protein